MFFIRSARGHAVELGVNAQVFFNSEIGIAGQRLRNDADHASHRIGVLGSHRDPQQSPGRR